MKLPKIELLMSLEQHRNRMDRARTKDMIKQCEDAIRAAEIMKEELRKARRLLAEKFNRHPSSTKDIALRIDEVLDSSRQALATYTSIVPEREDEPATIG